MRLTPSLHLPAVVTVLGCAAATSCVSNTNADGPSPSTTTASDSPGDGGADGVEGLKLELEKTEVEPGESTKVTVRVSPRQQATVQLALIDGSNAAFLDDPSLLTGDDGLASTRLTVVASTRDSVRLLARTQDEQAEATIEIRERSVADLAIVPLYAGGRAFDTWDVLWGADLRCDLGYDDKAWEAATSVSRQSNIDGVPPAYELLDVSARQPLTVIVKAEQYAYGCVSGVLLTPKTLNRLEVPINQRFADVSALSLMFQMNIAEESEFWGTLLGPRNSESYVSRMASAFRGKETSDLTALLDAMERSPRNPSSVAFAQARDTADWDTVLADKLSPEGARSGLSSRVQRWLQAGAALLQAPDAIVAKVNFDTRTSRARLEPVSVAGVCPETCQVLTSDVGSVAVDAQDVLRLGFKLVFLPSPLLACLADRAVASGEDAGSRSVLSALNADFDCELVASWMANGEGVLFEGCDVACGAQLCTNALADLWARVVEHDVATASLEVNAAGQAALSSQAVVQGVIANWVGTTSFMDVETSVSGRLESSPTAEVVCE